MPPEQLTPEQCSMARNGLRLSVDDVAERAGVSRDSLKRLEKGDRIGEDLSLRVRAWFEDQGVAFTAGGVRLPMKVWRLVPADMGHRDWLASTYRGIMVIRAIGARRARQIASLACGIATRRVPGEALAINPWGQEARVAVEELTDDGRQGPAEAILEPAEYDREWRR